MASMAIRVVDRLFIVVYGTANPTDAEWSRYLDLVERHGVEATVQLIATDGGEPTAAQRRRLNTLLAGRMVPVAVVSASKQVRRTVATLSWFNRFIRAFSPGDLAEALRYMEVPEPRHALVAKELAALRLEVGVPDARAGAQR